MDSFGTTDGFFGFNLVEARSRWVKLQYAMVRSALSRMPSILTVLVQFDSKLKWTLLKVLIIVKADTHMDN